MSKVREETKNEAFTFDQATARRLMACHDALWRLVLLKDLKDLHGKTALYEKSKEEAWALAREALGIKDSRN